MSVGTSTAKYHPLATLGHGGMASVLLTVMKGGAGIHKLLVMKQMKPELASDADFVAMFLDEARLAARLSHPNVVHTFEVGESAGGPFIVMEYLEGQSLSGLLARVGRAAFPLPLHLLILRGILAGLEYAHDLTDYDGTPLHVVHRDVSPQNAFVCYDGRVKLVDFGIAKAAGLATQTREGVFKGKTGYMAPEQMAGGPIDRRADLFSVGVMMWEALARKRYTQGDTEAAVMWKRTHGQVPRLETGHPALLAVCHKALAFQPQDRFQNAREMIDALDAALQAEGLAPQERELARLVSTAFEAEREKIRAVIEAELSTMTLSGTHPHALPSLEGVPGSSSIPPIAAEAAAELLRRASLAHDTVPEQPLTPSVDGPLLLPARPSTRRSPMAALLGAFAGVVLLAGGVGVVAFQVKRASLVERPTVAANGDTAATAPPEAQPLTTEAAPAVTYRVTVVPRSARVEVDGQEAKDPSSILVPRSETRRLRVTAPGRAPREHLLAPGADSPARVDLSVELPVAGPVTRPVGAAKDPLDVDLRKGAKERRKIDETDPYAR